jgi:hypothetical protein
MTTPTQNIQVGFTADAFIYMYLLAEKHNDADPVLTAICELEQKNIYSIRADVRKQLADLIAFYKYNAKPGRVLRACTIYKAQRQVLDLVKSRGGYLQ